MTNASLQTVVRHIKNAAYVPPITDFQLGRLMYKSARSIEECTTDEMVHGWLSAEGDGESAYWLCMMKEAVQ